MLLVATGSRKVGDANSHWQKVRQTFTWVGGMTTGRPTLYVGGAGGLDRVAENIGRDLGWDVRVMAAAWTVCDPAWVDPIGKVKRCTDSHRRPKAGGGSSCPTAGFRRNQGMVDAVAGCPDTHRACLGFPVRTIPCNGTVDCMERAWRAGLLTITVPLAP